MLNWARTGILLGAGALMYSDALGAERIVPDPTVLLQGVESIREQIPPSFLYLRKEVKTASLHNVDDYHILFDGARRHYVETNSQNIAELAFDGTNVIYYVGVDCTFRNLDSGTGDLFADPRVF